MFNQLSSVLESVTKGKLSLEKAKAFLDEKYSLGSVYLKSLEKLGAVKDIVANNLQNVEFVPKVNGFESKFSLFCNINVSSDTEIASNFLQGCQLLSVHFVENAAVKSNRLKATFLNKFSVVRSDFCFSNFSFTRLSNVSLLESRFDNNKTSLSSLVDVSITESDFTHNSIYKSEISSTVINASRLSKIKLNSVRIEDCDFDKCDLQNIQFENCELKGCSFQDIILENQGNMVIANKTFVGKNIASCKTFEEFLAALEGNNSSESSANEVNLEESDVSSAYTKPSAGESFAFTSKNEGEQNKGYGEEERGETHQRNKHPRKPHRKVNKPKAEQPL
ncbi:MAG: pentapeptide repeat-containing protein [Silvanigrellaceae bacterium]|nr:pentapeptide repeat-containing protein [Silvanigrellaceae bacterium]